MTGHSFSRRRWLQLCQQWDSVAQKYGRRDEGAAAAICTGNCHILKCMQNYMWNYRLSATHTHLVFNLQSAWNCWYGDRIFWNDDMIKSPYSSTKSWHITSIHSLKQNSFTPWEIYNFLARKSWEDWYQSHVSSVIRLWSHHRQRASLASSLLSANDQKNRGKASLALVDKIHPSAPLKLTKFYVKSFFISMVPDHRSCFPLILVY